MSNALRGVGQVRKARSRLGGLKPSDQAQIPELASETREFMRGAWIALEWALGKPDDRLDVLAAVDDQVS